MFKIPGLILFIVILILSVVSWWGGAFDRVTLEEDTIGPFQLVYREYKGPYSGSKFLLKSVVSYLKQTKKIQVLKGFSIFYDDPSKTSSENLRCSAGAVVDSLMDVEPPYKSSVFKQTDAIIGTYPIRSFFSYVTGVYKLHNALNSYCKSYACDIVLPIVEMYDIGTRKIIYIVPIGRTDSPAPEFGPY